MSEIKLTPALRRMLEFIAGGGDAGRMELQIHASGRSETKKLDRLRWAGYVERNPITHGRFDPDRIPRPVSEHSPRSHDSRAERVVPRT